MNKRKLVRVATVPLSFDKLLGGQMKFISQYYNITAISAEEGCLKNIGEKEGVETLTINLTRKITPWQDLLAVLKLYKFLKSEKPFIIHTHTPKAGIVGMLAGFLAKTPHRLHTVAGLPLLEASGVKRKLLDVVEKVTYACATKVYPNSNELLKIIVKNKLASSNKLKVIGNGSSNGIDTSYFCTDQFKDEALLSLKNDLGINETDFVFVFVGRLVTDKGINELVESFSKINKTHHNVKLLLVGPFEEDLDPIFVETKSEIHTNKNIITTGFVNDVRPYFAISNVLTFPSYREGFPNVVMQAGAMELPAIVSNINGCNEIVFHNENGLIINPKNKEELYLAMKAILLDNDLYATLKLNARPYITKRFEQEVLWNEILKEYEKLEIENV